MNGNLKKHIQSVHERISKFRCEYCSKSFSEKGNMKQHISMVHEKKKKFNCDICAKSISSKTYLRKHFEKFHEENSWMQVSRQKHENSSVSI